MTDAHTDPRDAEIERLRAQVSALRRENEELDGQVSLLVRTEHRLTRAQHEADRQIARVRALSSFALAYSTREEAADIADRAAKLLVEWFSVDRVVVVRRDEHGGVYVEGDGVSRLSAPAELERACLGVEPLVTTLAEVSWAQPMTEQADRTRLPLETVFAVLPLGGAHEVIGLALSRVVLRRASGSAAPALPEPAREPRPSRPRDHEAHPRSA